MRLQNTEANAEATGTSLEPEHHQDQHGHRERPDDHEHAWETADLVRIGLVALACLASWLGLWRSVASFDVIGLVVALVGGYPIFREAVSNILARRMTMELSMTIALAAALAVGQILTVLVIIFFVLVAEVLEKMTVSRGRHAIRHLVSLLPREATVRRNGETARVGTSELRPGDVVLVAPGANIPVDGVVVGGRSSVDQSAITGESLPVEKAEGALVYAGTINQSGALEVRAGRIGRDTAFGKIIEAVERAEKSRAPIQKTADRLAGYLVYFAMVCAVFTYVVTRDTLSTISVVIVAGACGIAAGTPLAILGAIGRAARGGVIVKGGIYLEVLGKVDTVVFDKTGTVTLGAPRVTSVQPCDGVEERAVIEAAAIAERRSEHPLAKAILSKAAEMGLSEVEPERFTYLPGKGIVCAVDGEEIVAGSPSFFRQRGLSTDGLLLRDDPRSQVLVARGNRVLGVIDAADDLRPEAAGAVAALGKLGIRTVLLTGDSPGIAEAVGQRLQVNEVLGDLLPEDKVRHINTLARQGRSVAMVGDGINDAPALAEAHVGVAVGSGTDVAKESADVVLLGNDLMRLVETIHTARWCRRIILANFAGTLIVDGIGVGLAAFGLLTPLFAALIHVVSESVFILNSARLLPGVSPGSAGQRVPGDERSLAV